MVNYWSKTIFWESIISTRNWHPLLVIMPNFGGLINIGADIFVQACIQHLDTPIRWDEKQKERL